MKTQNIQKNKPLNEIAGIDDAILMIVGIKTLIYSLTYLFSYVIMHKLAVKSMKQLYTSTPDVRLSNKLTEITGDVVKVFKLRNGILVPPGEPNAFAVGGKDVFYSPGMAKLMNEREMIAVLLHEYGHNKEMHVGKHMITNSFIGIFSFALMGTLVTVGEFAFTLTRDFLYTMIFKELIRLPLNIFVGNTLSRKHEFVADSYAAKYGYGKEMISCLSKLEYYIKERMCGEMKDTIECSALLDGRHAFSTHPSFRRRIERLYQIVSKRLLFFAGSSNTVMEAILKVKLYKNSFIERVEDNIKNKGE